MMNTIQWLGLYPDTIEDVVERCESALSDIGFSTSELDDFHTRAKAYLEEGDADWDDLTNQILYAYLSTTVIELKEKRDELGLTDKLEFDFYVNCDDSHLNFAYDDEWLEYHEGDNDLKDAFADAAFAMIMEEQEVAEVVAVCHTAMEEIGMGDEESLKKLEKMVKSTILAVNDFEDIDADMVQRTFNAITAKEMGEFCESHDIDIKIFHDKNHIYLNNDVYEEGAISELQEDTKRKALKESVRREGTEQAG